MSLFAQFAINKFKEADGVEITYGENSDGTTPTFILCRMGKSNRKYAKAMEVATRPYRRQLELGTLSNAIAEKLTMEVFVETVLVGWSDVQNEDGDLMDFSKENAIGLMTALPELYDDLQEKAKSVALFRDESREEDAKN